jgi:predicted  nucleic acid-binding Zn-ribbon protein
MTTLMEKLLTAQKALLRLPNKSAEHESVLHDLTKNIPAPILAHYLRLITQGRNGVALVRHGVCCECHLRVASSLAAILAKSEDLHLCENCGCYLALAPDEQSTVAPAAAAPAPAARPARKARRVSRTVTA